ncbi:MAG: PAS domain-containing sensor histidine kinase, partial [Holophaga sp.]|nr:PAS domain-containing sensor histidine kinase [Holophaga sp.]
VKTWYDEGVSGGISNLRLRWAEKPQDLALCASLIQVQDINRASGAFFGVACKEDLPAEFASYFDEESWAALRDGLIALLEGAMTFQTEMPIQSPQLGPRLLQVHVTVAEGFEATLGQVLVSFLDITDRKRAESSRHAAEQRYHSLFQNMLQGSLYGLVLYRGEEPKDFLFLDVNDALATMTGWQDATGRKVSEVVPGIHQSNPEFLALVGRVAATGKAEQLDCLFPSLGFWLGITVHSPEKGYFVALFENTTQRKQQELLSKESEALTAKSQMAAYVAHEINGPLAGIKSAFALLQTAIPKDHTYYSYVALVDREIDRITAIVRMMYELYRPNEPKAQKVAVATLLQDIATLLNPRCRSHRVTLVLDPGEPGLRGTLRANLLRQVLFNLLQNAIEATPPQGTVRCCAQRDGADLVIQVSDGGPGIPPGLAEKVWESGFTTKQNAIQGGMGLGLSTCRRLLESLCGSIYFENPLTGGCVFTVRIPLDWESGVD